MSSIPKKGRPVDSTKREAIIQAAVNAFFEGGFAGTSIEQVAADAGVSKVTVYNHFGDKRALFTAAIESVCSQIRNHFLINEDVRGTLRTRLLTIGEAMVAFLSRPEMVQFERRIAAETVNEPEIGAAFLTAGPHRMKEALAAFLRAMTDAGELDIEDHLMAAEQFASMCKGMGDLERRFGHPTDPARDRARIEGAVEVFCRAYVRTPT